MKRIVVVALWFTAAVALANCGRGGSDTSTSGTSASGAAPASGGPAAVSKYDSGPRAAETPIDESKVAQGQQLFQTKGCTACHAMGKKLTGPDLAGVTQRRTTAWMENQILHPDVMTKEDPISHQLFAQFALQMPNQGLTAEEAAAVIEFFKHSDHEAAESASKED